MMKLPIRSGWMVDLINCATSGDDRLRGLGVAGSNVAIPHRLSLSPLKRRVKRKCVIKLCARSCVSRPSTPLQESGRSPPPVFGPFLLWPNGWIHCVRRGLSYLPRKEHSSPRPLSCGPYLLWPRSRISATAEVLYPLLREYSCQCQSCLEQK